MTDAELQELFAEMRRGSMDAFAELYSAMKTPVFTVIYRMTVNKETAEDLTHDLFVKLHTSPPDPTVQKLRAWIFRMARNLAIDALRKRHDAGPLRDSAHDAGSLEELVCTRCDVEEAMRKLTEQERETVSLHLTAELTFREIAEITGSSLPRVYRIYKRALAALRDALNGGLI